MDSSLRITRRDALLLGAMGTVACTSTAKPLAAPPPASLVERNDAAVRSLLAAQSTDRDSPFRGSVPDAFGLHHAGSASGLIETMAASFVHPGSAFCGDAVLLQRIGLAAGFLERAQGPQGNIDLLVTNFNSPPDTGFVVHGVATAAAIGRRHGAPAIADLLQAFLVKAGSGMAAGGVHTPNHRWVVCSALAQVNELFPDERYLRRIDAWLAEGIDIDADGQFTERSTLTYNVITDRALVVLAAKLQRPELLEPVRRNLRTLTYLLHADGEVVTEISRRQDQYTRGNVGGYWFPLTWLALRDQDGEFAALAHAAEPTGARLSTLLEYPELSQPLCAPQPLPTDFEKHFAELGITRIRRGPLSATVVLGGNSRLLTLRCGEAVLEGLRMAVAFFGKGQFIPDTAELRGGVHHLRQTLEAPYYQPLAEPVTTRTWADSRSRRQHSEVCRLEQSAEITATARGFQVRLQSRGTNGVPVAVELCFRDDARLEGCRALSGEPGAFVLEQGTGVCRVGKNSITFGPGAAGHRYVQVRGAEPRLPGQSVYLTGFTPFDRTIDFECE